ncbi:hypothetical protein [Acidovorax sp. M2(2025)]|uniref:hypothetical protein n=1 Tax=Acidovorax sp. M2(2025) TaxID=3411355 RepID=UPI003BF4917E
MTSPQLSDPSASPGPVPVPTAAQQKVLDRIALQRERLRARRAARAQAMALAQRDAGTVGADESLALRAAGFARQHPLAVAAMAGVALVAGPRRLVRWAGVVLPLVMRLRR